MSISAPFIRRPVATTLLLIAMTMAGAIAYTLLPVSALPEVDFPTIYVFANLPGASPDVMAASVATPLEKQFTRIAGVTAMTSRSGVGQAGITLQFDLSRDINGAARDVQAAINAAAGFLPTNLPTPPRYRKINPADQPILLMTLESDVVPRPQLYDIASSVFAQKLSQVNGVGQVQVGGSSLPAVRVEVNPQPLSKYNVGLDQIGTFLQSANANRPKGAVANGDVQTSHLCHRSAFPCEGIQRSGGGLSQRRACTPFGPRTRDRWERRHPQPRHRERQSHGADPDQPPAQCQRGGHRGAHQGFDAGL